MGLPKINSTEVKGSSPHKAIAWTSLPTTTQNWHLTTCLIVQQPSGLSKTPKNRIPLHSHKFTACVCLLEFTTGLRYSKVRWIVIGLYSYRVRALGWWRKRQEKRLVRKFEGKIGSYVQMQTGLYRSSRVSDVSSRELIWNKQGNSGCDVRKSPVRQLSLLCADFNQPCWFQTASANFVLL